MTLAGTEPGARTGPVNGPENGGEVVTDPIVITVLVSDPYTLIAGGWTGLRPVGMRRDYRATVNGDAIHNTSKVGIQRVIRAKLYRSGVRGRIVFRFTDDNTGEQSCV